jgi:hypothetical protein
MAVEPAPQPVVEAENVEPERQGFFARWLFRRRHALPQPIAAEPQPIAAEPESVAEVEPEPMPAEPEPAPKPEPEPEPVAPEPEPLVATVADRVQQVLDGTLDTLGQAHHRPFSRG